MMAVREKSPKNQRSLRLAVSQNAWFQISGTSS
jgi:hypothetical protein